MIADILLPAAGTLLFAIPCGGLRALYRWDTATWPDRVAVARAARIRRTGYCRRGTAAGRALADRAGLYRPAQPPEEFMVDRDLRTQPTFARVDLRRDLPGRPA